MCHQKTRVKKGENKQFSKSVKIAIAPSSRVYISEVRGPERVLIWRFDNLSQDYQMPTNQAVGISPDGERTM